MSMTKKKAVATAVIWFVCVALLLVGKPIFGPDTGSWGWSTVIVAVIITVLIWARRRTHPPLE